MAKDSPKSPVRITTQFRKGQAMVYDLSCEDVRLTIEMTLRENAEGLEQWSVGAHARQAPDKPSIDELGPTRRDALTAVASSWLAKRGAYGFPSLDWDAVTQALLAVRAI